MRKQATMHSRSAAGGARIISAIVTCMLSASLAACSESYDEPDRLEEVDGSEPAPSANSSFNAMEDGESVVSPEPDLLLETPYGGLLGFFYNPKDGGVVLAARGGSARERPRGGQRCGRRRLA